MPIDFGFMQMTSYVPKVYVQRLHKYQMKGLAVDRLDGIILSKEGEILVKVFWFGFDEPAYEPLDNVVAGAHMMLAKYLETHPKLDKIITTAVRAAIKARLKVIEAINVRTRKSIVWCFYFGTLLLSRMDHGRTQTSGNASQTVQVWGLGIDTSVSASQKQGTSLYQITAYVRSPTSPAITRKVCCYPLLRECENIFQTTKQIY